MPANIVDAGVDDVESVLKSNEAQGPGLLLVLFLSDHVGSTGVSWCPDCAKAEPMIYRQANDITEKHVTLVRVYVGDKPTWRTPEHPLRTNKRFMVQYVPTLMRWENGRVATRLEDYEAGNETKSKRIMRIGRTSSRTSSMSSSSSQSRSSPRSKSKSKSYTSK